MEFTCLSTLARPSWLGVELARLSPMVMALPGFMFGSVLLLVVGTNPVRGQNTTTVSPGTNTTSDPGPNIAAIVAPTVIGVLAIASAVLVWLFCVVKKKRQTEGTYRPRNVEQSGERSVVTPDALKLPKEERLI